MKASINPVINAISLDDTDSSPSSFHVWLLTLTLTLQVDIILLSSGMLYDAMRLSVMLALRHSSMRSESDIFIGFSE